MNKISIEQVKRELLKYQTPTPSATKIKNQSKFDVQSQIIINQIELYNELINLYEAGDTKKLFYLNQLDAKIFKQLQELKKGNDKGQDNQEPDKLTDLINNLKSKKNEQR